MITVVETEGDSVSVWPTRGGAGVIPRVVVVAGLIEVTTPRKPDGSGSVLWELP
ncbi:MAG: hypothetical protein ACRENX_07925 [Candidatus Dormibacteria bacterium]